MKLKSLQSFLPFLLLLTSCENGDKRKNEINKISLTTGSCYGKCPVQTIEIDKNLVVKYHGLTDAKLKGYYIGSITPQIWDSLNSRLERMDYKKLDSVYDNSADDPPIYLKIYYNDSLKIIRGQSASLPVEVAKLYRWFTTVPERIKLDKTTDTLNFEKEYLKFTYPRPPTPPMPKDI